MKTFGGEIGKSKTKQKKTHNDFIRGELKMYGFKQAYSRVFVFVAFYDDYLCESVCVFLFFSTFYLDIKFSLTQQ